MITETAITGSEPTEGDISSPIYALIEFYRAFNNADIELMSRNWQQTDEASMSNPLGGVKRGWESIAQVYARIFSSTAQVYVEFYDYTIHQSDGMFLAVGRERGYFRQGDNEIELSIRTSRTFRMDGGMWRQVHHHGSIESPVLLQQYQTAVLKKI
ncbi:MAG: nuclear transport factor 2 family protein [Thiohalomonadales bacterium]